MKSTIARSLTHWFCVFQGVQERANLTSPILSKEDPIFSSLSHKLGRNVDEVGHRIQQALLRVSQNLLFFFLVKRKYFLVFVLWCKSHLLLVFE